MKTKYLAVCLLLLGYLVLLAPASLMAVPPRPLGDSKVLTPIPALPGYPEGIAVREGLVYVSGPASFGVPGDLIPSKTFAYDEDTGALVKTITIQGQTDPLNALLCSAFGEGDNLVFDVFVNDKAANLFKDDED